MSFLFPREAHWAVAGWISHAFFRDASEFLVVAPSFAEDVRFCIASETDTIDLRDADVAKVRELIGLVDRVIATNRQQQGVGFARPEAFPVYLQKLDELRATAYDVLDELGPPMTDAEFATEVARRRREDSARDLEAAEQHAARHGKEPFDLARLAQLLEEPAGGLDGQAQLLREKYYLLYPELRTLAELAQRLVALEGWR